MSETVRPTIRALADLGMTLPPLDVELNLLANPLVLKAQTLPGGVAAGGAERVRALNDRVWFKVKAADLRGAAGEVAVPEAFGPRTDAALPGAAWWLVAAGYRQDDTKNRDFYARLESECQRAAKGSTDTVNSKHLEPTSRDYRRWQLENTALAVVILQRKVLEAIARAAQTGKAWRVNLGAFHLGALVEHVSGDSYLAITADGFWDNRVLAVLLDAVPGVGVDDWQIEPSDVIGIEPRSGQIIYSAMIPAGSLAQILDVVDEHFL